MKKVLLVDDEEDIVGALTIRLKASGYDVISASNGMEGLEKARSEKPDVILLDIMLPKLDGYKVCRILKFDEKFKNIPIIMVTGKFGEENRKLGMDVGADAYILKPFNPKELMAKIEEVLTKKE